MSQFPPARPNDGGPAFPVPNDANVNGQEGMTLRAYIATEALSAFMSGHVAHYGHDSYWSPKEVADVAVTYADSLIAALEVQP